MGCVFEGDGVPRSLTEFGWLSWCELNPTASHSSPSRSLPLLSSSTLLLLCRLPGELGFATLGGEGWGCCALALLPVAALMCWAVLGDTSGSSGLEEINARAAAALLPSMIEVEFLRCLCWPTGDILGGLGTNVPFGIPKPAVTAMSVSHASPVSV